MSIENGINNILSTTAKAVGDLISKIAYTYDEYGNRKSMIRTGVGESSVSYTYDMNNRLLSETKGIYDRTEITDYTYDPNGNQLYKVSGSSQNTHTNESEGVNIWLTKPEESYYEKYEYNLFNRLTEVQKNGITSTYTYDGNGQRQSKEAKGVTTNHIWSGGNIVAETKADGEIKSNYYYGLKLYGLETPVIDTYDVCDAYYSYNGHGDVTKLVGTDGKVIINYDYDAFGNEIGNDYTIYNPFHYNGQYTDFEGETGLIYLRNRYYDPSIGRFTQEDPAQDGLNWYVYCVNDPVNMVDPWGLEPKVPQTVNIMGTFVTRETADKIQPYIDELIEYVNNNTVYDEEYVKGFDAINNKITELIDNDTAITLYSIPVWQQENNTCWACVDAMVYMYENNITNLSKENKEKVTAYFNSAISYANKEGRLSWGLSYRGISANKNSDSAEFLAKVIKNGPIKVTFSGSGNMDHSMLVVGVMQIDGETYIKYNDSNAKHTSDWVTYEEFTTYEANGVKLTFAGSYL